MGEYVTVGEGVGCNRKGGVDAFSKIYSGW